MTWFSFALIAALSFSAYSIATRLSLKDHGDAKIFAVLSQLAVAGFLLLLIPFDRMLLNVSWQVILMLLVASGIYAGATVLFIWGRQLEEVSKVSLARQTTTVWVFIGGVMVFGEPFTVTKVTGVVLIAVGSIIALWQGTRLSLTRGMMLIFAGALFGSINSLISKTIVEENLSPSLYIPALAGLSALWLFLALPDSRNRLIAEARLQGSHVLVVGATLGLAIFMVMKAYQVGEASRVGPVYNSSLIFTLVAGIIFLGERENTPFKLVGAVVVAAGILMLRLL